MVINTNIPAIIAKNCIGITNLEQERTAHRLSSGYRINSASDDAASLAISEKMRAQIRGLDQAGKNIDDAINLFQTGDGAVAEINNMIIRIKELSVQACNDTNEDEDRVKMDDEMQHLLKEIDAISERTEFNKKKILKPYGKETTTTSSDAVNLHESLRGEYKFESNEVKTVLKKIVLPTNKPPINTTSPPAGNVTTQFKIESVGTIYIDVGYWVSHESPDFENFIKNEMYESDGTITEKNKNKFVESLLKGLNAGFKEANSNIPELLGGFGDDGHLYLGFADSPYKITNMTCYGSSLSTALGHTFLHLMFKDSSTASNVNINTSTTAESSNTYPKRSIWVQSGANANQGDQYTWNTICADQLGLAKNKLSTWNEANKTLKKVDGALQFAVELRAKFGAYMNSLEAVKKSVSTSSINTSAAESRIRDADMAKEMMEHSKANILQQAGISMLAQANQAPQAIMQLLQ